MRLAVCAKIFYIHKSGGGKNHPCAPYVYGNCVIGLRNADIGCANLVLTSGITARKWPLNLVPFAGKSWMIGMGKFSSRYTGAVELLFGARVIVY